MTKRILVPALFGIAVLVASIPAIALLMSVPSEAEAKSHKKPVCHYRLDTDTYKLLKLGNQNAVDKHLANHQYDHDNDPNTALKGDVLPDANTGLCP